MSLDERRSESDVVSEQGTVLVVDDDPHLVGMYAAMLEDTHTVLTATSGEEALVRLSNEVDVLLLDRRMPGLSGDEVLETVREEGYDCRVAMITSVDPDTDIVEMEFDAYVVKPVRRQDLREFVESLLLRARCGRDTRELLSVTSKIVALESRFDEDSLDDNEEYRRLRERRERLEAKNRERIAELIDRDESRLVFRDVLQKIIESQSVVGAGASEPIERTADAEGGHDG
ncbi:response regulator [Haloplanus rubicundus]|uniref:Response regulator n=1 Tax=Haloplanus rubicundus TaxID=1547898 RepID=A0A345EDD4_9EURY|nr:response regulator [Haloplanus rubicundus]AXG06832.1 response regulator [Haloplanus rubicundus]AXG10206.1 response regulator [Haloplanus rubicundus]